MTLVKGNDRYLIPKSLSLLPSHAMHKRSSAQFKSFFHARISCRGYWQRMCQTDWWLSYTCLWQHMAWNVLSGTYVNWIFLYMTVTGFSQTSKSVRLRFIISINAVIKAGCEPTTKKNEIRSWWAVFWLALDESFLICLPIQLEIFCFPGADQATQTAPICHLRTWPAPGYDNVTA